MGDNIHTDATPNSDTDEQHNGTSMDPTSPSSTLPNSEELSLESALTCSNETSADHTSPPSTLPNTNSEELSLESSLTCSKVTHCVDPDEDISELTSRLSFEEPGGHSDVRLDAIPTGDGPPGVIERLQELDPDYRATISQDLLACAPPQPPGHRRPVLGARHQELQGALPDLECLDQSNSLFDTPEGDDFQCKDSQGDDSLSSSGSPTSGSPNSSPARGRLDPQSVFLNEIAKELTERNVRAMKLLPERSACPDSRYVTIAAGDRERIQDGYDLIHALRIRIPDYVECLQTLSSLCRNAEVEFLVSRIERELAAQTIQVGSGSRSSQDGSGPPMKELIKVLPSFPKYGQIRSPLELTKVKTFYLTRMREIVCVNKKYKDPTIVSIPANVWLEVLRKESEIREAYKKYKESRTEQRVHLIGNVFATVNTWENAILIHVRQYYRDSEGNLQPSRAGISVTEPRWNRFLDFLRECTKHVI